MNVKINKYIIFIVAAFNFLKYNMLNLMKFIYNKKYLMPFLYNISKVLLEKTFISAFDFKID